MAKTWIECVLALAWFVAGGSAYAQAPDSRPPAPPLDWKSAETPPLTGHVQLTSRAEFVKAGEAYFSPDGGRVIFQAVLVPEAGKEPEPFYSMYVGTLMKDAGGRVTGLKQITRVSPAGSANTCGWFAPDGSGDVLFGSTLVRPAEEQKSGFQVGTRKYVWMFPHEMEVVRARFADGAYAAADAVFTRPNYDAECSYSKDGRFILYSHVEDTKEGERPDANIYVYDTATKKHTALVVAPGYDGGPFFSPDGRSICYRSDRLGNDLLQLFVADVKFERGADGKEIPAGIEREYQITENGHVNWGPYWHPSGRFLVYATSEVSHANYEVFAIEVDRDRMQAAEHGEVATVVVPDLRRARVTFADGADVLPVFSADGKYLMWTSQRGAKTEGEAKPSSQLWLAEWTGEPAWEKQSDGVGSGGSPAR